MKSLFFSFILSIFSVVSKAQDVIDVIEKNIKVGGVSREIDYYGFAEGDKVIFNLSVEKGKELKDVTITQYPKSVKFAYHTVEKIKDKIINISKTGIYKFEYYNSNISGRTINIKIQRIPKDESTKSFNTNVTWINKVDTIYQAQTKTYIIGSDTTFTEVINSTVRVHSQTNLDHPDKTIVDFILPANTLKWTYWIGVGDESQKTFEQDKQRFASAGAKLLSTINPLAGIAFGLFAMTQGNIGDNVIYYFLPSWEDVQKFMSKQTFMQFKQGNAVIDFGLINASNSRNQKYYIGLQNDNLRQGINVNVKILAVVVNTRTEDRVEKTPIYTNTRIPINEQ
jgi:hypothetical protein